MDPEHVVQGQLDAFNARDIERFLSFYDSDALIEDGQNNTLARGHEAMRAMYNPLFAQSPDLHAAIPQRIRVGAYVIDEETLTGFILPGFPPDVHAAAVYRVEGSAIMHVRLLMA
jgi:hypothetical protein